MCRQLCPTTISQRQDCDSSSSLWSDLSKSLSKIDFWQDIQHVTGWFLIWASRTVNGTLWVQSCILRAFCISICIPSLHGMGILPNSVSTHHPWLFGWTLNCFLQSTGSNSVWHEKDGCSLWIAPSVLLIGNASLHFHLLQNKFSAVGHNNWRNRGALKET